MKKVLVVTLGLAFALGTISFSAAQDTTDTTQKKTKKKKKDTTKTEESK